MKRIIGIIMALALILCACSFRSAPEKSLCKMLGELQTGNFTKAEKQLNGVSFHMNLKNKYAKQFYKAVYKDMRFSVTDAEVKEASAEIMVSITMLDTVTLISETSYQLFDQMLINDKQVGKALYETMMQKIESGEVGYITSTSIVQMVKSKTGWQVDLINSPSFAAAISGGMPGVFGYAGE